MESRAGFLCFLGEELVSSRGRVALPPFLQGQRQRVNELAGPGAAGAAAFVCFLPPPLPASGVCEALEIRVVDPVRLLRWRNARTRGAGSQFKLGRLSL
jgi:hypothetical protein